MFQSDSTHREAIYVPCARSLRALLLASASVILFATASFAGDGDGGRGGGVASGAYGGTSSLTGTGNAGNSGTLNNGVPGGGGGGGSGVTGGAGGTGYGVSGMAGGAGGTAATTSGGVVTGGNGADALANTTNDMGGGGGGGAAHAYSGDLTNLTETTYIGGSGGAGGSAQGSATGGGGGGGGFGAVLTGLTGGVITLSPTSFTGGAGGASAAGARGGSGGSGLYIDSPTGSNHLTIGATLTGGAGGAGDSFGGAGGTGFQLWSASGATTVDINATVQGGTGGVASDMQSAPAHIGGDGGYGVVIGKSPGAILNVNADIIAGNGGAGVEQGGSGGVGIFADDTTINVNGGVTGVVIQGGEGGAGTTQGVGGQGIYGGGLNITLTGKVAVNGGGSSPAIAFYGDSSLTLVAEPGIGNYPTLNNGVKHEGSSDSLTLSGTGTGSLATAVTNGFTSVTKSGTGTWTLTGSSDQSVTQWTISGGTLSVSRPVFGPSAGLTLSGGTLEITQTVPLSTAISVTADSSLSAADGATLTLNGALSGSGAITKSGAGTLSLRNANSSYTGAVTVSAGLLALSGAGSLSNAASLTLGTGTTLDISGTTSGTTVNNLSSTDSSATVLLGSQTLTVNATGTSAFSGVISGSGGLNVTINVDFILGGNNTYTGTTTVSGNLVIGYLSASGSVAGNITVNAGGALIFGRSDTYSIQNSIAAAAGSTVGFGGGGTYSYAGSGVISGAVEVQGGELHLIANEFANASSLTLDTGGTLSGNGTVGNLIVKNGGIVAPGNSPGNLAVNGTVAFNAGSTYRVDVTPTGEHDLLTATGAVTISGGTVQIEAVPGDYAANSRYAILTAGSVTGTFTGVTENYAFLDGALSYDPTNVFLTLTYTGASFATYARTPNQLGTAVAAQALGDGNAIYDALLLLPENAVPAAFDALSGEAYASVSSVLQQQSIYVRDAVSGRLRQALTAPGVSALAYGPGPVKAPLAEGYAPTLWAQGYGGWGNTNGNGNAATISNTIGGFLMGADVSVAENARAGLFGGYSRSTFDVDGRSSSGSANNVDLGLYAGAQFGAVALRGGAAYTWHDLSMSRSVVFPGFAESLKGSDTTGTAQVFGEIGYDVEVGAIAFEPFLGLAYVNVSGASLGEEGGAAALSVSTDDMSTFYSTLGVRLATTVEVGGRTLTPYATLGWQHAFGDVTPTASNQFAGGLTPFSVSGVPVAEDALLVEAGLSYALSPNAQIGATYAGQLAGDASQNAFTAQFSLRF